MSTRNLPWMFCLIVYFVIGVLSLAQNNKFFEKRCNNLLTIYIVLLK